MNTQGSFSFLRTGVALLAFFFAGHAAASDTTGAVAADGPEADAAKPTDKAVKTDKAVTDIAGVTVTVERREQDLQKYAGTAQSLSQDDLRGLGINNELRNIQVAIPGLNIANQEGNTEIFIRGVGSANNTELGDPGAAPHINGNYIPRPRGVGMMFYDLERVEVNKGPQGTLRGRNALAGTLNIVTKKPELGVTNGYAQAEVANRDSRGAEAAVNFPIGDQSALRISGYHVYKDTSFENAGITSLRAAGIQDETATRLSFLTNPTDALSIFLMADYGHEAGTGYPGANIYGAARAGFGPEEVDLRQVVYRGNEGKLDSTSWGAQANIGYDFGRVRLEYNGSYRDVDFEQRNASSDGILYPGRDVSAAGEDYDVFSSVFWQTRSQSQTHELRLSSADDSRFRWTAGGFYFKEKQQVGFFSVADKGYCCYSGTEFTMPKVEGKSWAGFADGTFDVNDKFRVKAGVRYTDESKLREGIGGNWALTLGGDGFGCCFATRLGTAGFVPALLDRPNFNVTGLTPAQVAQFLIDGVITPGQYDTLIQQLIGIANGTVPNGNCVVRPDTSNGGAVTCTTGQHSFANLTIPTVQKGSSQFNFTDWRLGFEADLAPGHLFYGTVSTGHKAGGFNDSFSGSGIPETFKPESIIAYEIGSKNTFEFAGRRATFNVAGFYYDYRDQVFQDLTVIAVDAFGNATGYALSNRNVGKSTIAGVEAEAMFQFDHGVTFTLNGLYLDTKIKEGVVADIRSQNFGAGGITSEIDLAGNKLPLSSKIALNARLQQVFEMKGGTFDWQALVSYRSSYYLTQFNDRDVVFVSDTAGTVDRVEDAQTAGFPDKEKDHTQLNIGLGYTPTSGKWRLEGWGSNLFNTDISQKALVGSGIDVRFLNDARSYGIRFRSNF